MPSMQDYKLPVKVPQRNFPHVQAEQLPATWDTAGTTETDSKTAPKDGGYTKINSR